MSVRVMRHRNETRGWHVCAGRVKHVVDLDPTVACIGSRDGAAGRVANAPGGPEVGEHAPEGITTKLNFCVEALRQNAERAGKARRLRRYPSLIRTSRPRASTCGAVRAERQRRPLQPRRTYAPAKKRARRRSQAREVCKRRKVSDQPKYYCRYIYSTRKIKYALKSGNLQCEAVILALYRTKLHMSMPI